MFALYCPHCETPVARQGSLWLGVRGNQVIVAGCPNPLCHASFAVLVAVAQQGRIAIPDDDELLAGPEIAERAIICPNCGSTHTLIRSSRGYGDNSRDVYVECRTCQQRATFLVGIIRELTSPWIATASLPSLLPATVTAPRGVATDTPLTCNQSQPECTCG